MAPIALEETNHSQTSPQVLVKPWSRPQHTKEPLDWAPLATIDLSRFDEPGGKQELAAQLYDAVTRVGFWVVTNTGIDDERVLRQFSIGNTFSRSPLRRRGSSSATLPKESISDIVRTKDGLGILASKRISKW